MIIATIIMIGKMLQIPFYVCEGRRCAQISMKSILSFKKIYKSIEELDELVDSKSENPITVLQIVNALDKLGIDFRYPVRPDFEKISTDISINELKEKTKQFYPMSLYSRFNYDSIKESFSNIKSKKLYEVLNFRPSLRKLKEFIDYGRIPLCLVNIDKLINRKNKRRGHYLILTDIGEKYVYAHDSGPKEAMPNRPIEINRFLECWELGIIDWDLVII